MNYEQLCAVLKPADRIITPIAFGFTHHAIYLGADVDGQQWVIENRKREWVTFTRLEDFLSFGNSTGKIDPFKGSEEERQQAIQRAWSVVGQPYYMLESNCEHFANFVQHGKASSPQILTGLFVAASIGFAISASRNSSKRPTSKRRKRA